jgi:hypothetical protein
MRTKKKTRVTLSINFSMVHLLSVTPNNQHTPPPLSKRLSAYYSNPRPILTILVTSRAGGRKEMSSILAVQQRPRM